ncbi:hypothetical protein JCM6882_001279 [Rhodosporidiobolus microsporus]
MDGYNSPYHSPLKRPANDDHYAAASGAAAGSGADSNSNNSSGTGTPLADGGGYMLQSQGHGAGQGQQAHSDSAEREDGAGGGGGSAKRTKTGAPPLKRGSACTLCRKRKLRCDGVRPKCGTCLRLNHDCQYGDPHQERIMERQRELEDKIRSLEAQVADYRHRDESSSSAPAPASAYPPPHSHQHPHSSLPRQDSYPTPASYPPQTPYDASSQYPSNSPFPQQGYNPSLNGPVDSPYLSQQQQQQPHYSPTAANGYPLAPPSYPPHPPIPRRESEAFPLPPPGADSVPGGAGFLSHMPINAGGGPVPAPIPAGSAPGVQSFPFPMSTTTPQLSDLINPPSATSQPSGSAGGGGATYSPAGVPGPGGGMRLEGSSPERVQQGAFGSGTLASLAGQELPELEVMLDLADIYFTTIHTHLPFLHRRRFLYTLHHPASLSSPPSLALIFSVLAISAPYHDNPSLRALSSLWYHTARTKVEYAIAAGVKPSGARVATLTVEMVQALCLLALLEMGQSDHQRAFLSIGQAMRCSAMLGLTRMDEDRVAERTGEMLEKRLRPPALHQLPSDGVLLEECRRTICAVFVLDRFEAATVGWPAAISEGDIRVLLPCADELFESGQVDPEGRDNPLWWPKDGMGTSKEMGWRGVRAEEGLGLGGQGGGHENGAGDGAGVEEIGLPEDGGVNGDGVGADGTPLPKVGTFAWLCRVVWLGGRIQAETYRPSGPPAGGPWNKHVDLDPLGHADEMLEMDKVLEYIRARFGAIAAQKAREEKKVEGGVLMILLFINCMMVNLFHLNAASGLSHLPWDPSAPIYVGSAEYSMQRCWEAVHSMHEILAQLAGYENGRTTLHRSRATTFTAFIPYVLYALGFVSKFAIGDFNLLVAARDRTENVSARVAQDLPSGDDAFPPSYLEERLAFVDVACDAMGRIGAVWPIGEKFASMIRGDRMRLAARTFERQAAAAAAAATAANGPNSSPATSFSALVHPHSSTGLSPNMQSGVGVDGQGQGLYGSPVVGGDGSLPGGY